MKDIRALPLGDLPTLAEQQQAAQDVQAVQGMVAKLHAQITRKLVVVSELRRSVMRRAFSSQCICSEIGTGAEEAVA